MSKSYRDRPSWDEEDNDNPKKLTKSQKANLRKQRLMRLMEKSAWGNPPDENEEA